MADVVSQKKYVGGRGRGILGMNLSGVSEKPGNKILKEGDSKSEGDVDPDSEVQQISKVLIACFDYNANPEQPGGFPELSVKKGQLLQFISESPDNEHWWKARNEDGQTGYVPSSYVLLKEEESLPWLEQSLLEKREKERKERAQRHAQEQALKEGKGFGPPPKDIKSQQPYVYISAYNRNEVKSTKTTVEDYFCEMCDKKFNGPKPYRAHLLSRAHKEELELRAEEEDRY